MSGVVKFSEASSIAMHSMAVLAADPDRRVSIHEVAERLPISENHLAKVFQRLARAGLVESVRGPGGGFLLRGDPDRTTLLDVHEAIEGRLEASPCLFSPAQCHGDCVLGDLPREANLLVRERLARIPLARAARVLAARTTPVQLGGRASRARTPTGRSRVRH